MLKTILTITICLGTISCSKEKKIVVDPPKYDSSKPALVSRNYKYEEILEKLNIGLQNFHREMENIKELRPHRTQYEFKDNVNSAIDVFDVKSPLYILVERLDQDFRKRVSGAYANRIYGVPKSEDLSMSDIQAAVSAIMAESKISIVYDDSCPAIDKADAAASVSKYDVGADICFSLYELSKISKNTLDQEILGIIVHEFAHMLRFNEQDAITIQRAFVDNYNSPKSVFSSSSPASHEGGAKTLFLKNIVENANLVWDATTYILGGANSYEERCYRVSYAQETTKNMLEFLHSAISDKEYSNYFRYRVLESSSEDVSKLINGYNSLAKDFDVAYEESCINKSDSNFDKDFLDRIGNTARSLISETRNAFGVH